MRATRILVAAALSVAIATFPALGSAATNETVTIPGNFFSPQSVKIYVGNTVRWFNDTARNHTVISSSASSESFRTGESCGLLSGSDCVRPGSSFSHTFDARGTYTYYCRIHGSDAAYPNCGMCGRIVVVRRKASPTTGSSTPPSSASPSVSGSPSPSPTPSGLPGGSASTFIAEPRKDDEGASTNTWAIAGVGVALLGGAGLLVYRTMIRR